MKEEGCLGGCEVEMGEGLDGENSDLEAERLT